MNSEILITSSSFPDGNIEREILAPLGCKLTIVECKKEEEIIDAGKDAIGIIVTFTPIGKKVFEALPNLKIVVRSGIGVDNIDLAAANEHGVRVCNVPDYCINEVADHAMALLLSSERKIVQLHNRIASGTWDGFKAAKPIYGLKDRVLGLIGFGGIGRLLVSRAKAFGLKVIVYDPYINPEVIIDMGVTSVSYEKLLSEADFISLHVPLVNETHHIIDREALSKMKPNTYLINTARGPLIDREALKEALTNGKIAGAALDVIEDDLDGANSLTHLPNVIITPHTAFYSESSLLLLRKACAEEIARFIRGEPAKNMVV